ncbi:MAG: NAD-binding protein [Chloroflexi bacterium]|nr:NAD-binding protein [Chloroflexota bacterium]
MKVIIIGCGRVGSTLARALDAEGHDVVVLEEDSAAFQRLGPKFRGRTVVGVVFDRDVLLNAGIENADAVAAVTASDNANAVVARIAQQIYHVPKVVARLSDPRRAELFRRLGLPTISPTTWGVERIAQILCYPHFDPVLSFGSGEVNVIDVEATPALVGRTVNNITAPGETCVVAITRGGAAFIPTLGTVFQKGDLIHLAVLSSAKERLSGLLGLK